jgi:hypothetical protein
MVMKGDCTLACFLSGNAAGNRLRGKRLTKIVTPHFISIAPEGTMYGKSGDFRAHIR